LAKSRNFRSPKWGAGGEESQRLENVLLKYCILVMSQLKFNLKNAKQHFDWGGGEGGGRAPPLATPLFNTFEKFNQKYLKLNYRHVSRNKYF